MCCLHAVEQYVLGEQEGEFKLVVNPKSLLYLFGLQLDYRWVGFAVGPFLFSSQVGSIVGPHLPASTPAMIGLAWKGTTGNYNITTVCY